MTSAAWFHLTAYCWLIFLLYWIFSARKQKAAKTREPLMERLGQIVPMVAAYTLLFSWVLHDTWLAARFVPHAEWLSIAGVVLTVVGLSLAIWARRHLGTNWSAIVSIRADHELIHAGPYRTMRHPIYTGMLVGMLGTVLALGEVRGLLAFVITLTAFYIKARKEEKYLTREFGERFEAHRSRTGMFLPKI